VGGNEGWISPVVRRTRGAKGRAIWEILAWRAGLVVVRWANILNRVLSFGGFVFLFVCGCGSVTRVQSSVFKKGYGEVEEEYIVCMYVCMYVYEVARKRRLF